MDESRADPAKTSEPSPAPGKPVDVEAKPVGSDAPAPRRGLFGGFGAPPPPQTPEMAQRTVARRLRILGGTMAVLGCLFLFQYGTAAFTLTKVETWDEADGAKWNVELRGAASGNLTLDYAGDKPSVTVQLAQDVPIPVDTQAGHLTMTLTANNRTWTSERFDFANSERRTMVLNATAENAFPQTVSLSSLRNFLYPVAIASLVIVLAGVSMFRRILRPLAMTGAAIMVLLGVLVGQGQMLFVILLGGAGVYAFITIRRAGPLFAKGWTLTTPPLP